MIKLLKCDPKVLDATLANIQGIMGLEPCVADEVVEIDKSLLEKLRDAVDKAETDEDFLNLPQEIRYLMTQQLEQHRLLLATCIQESRSFVLYPPSLGSILGTSVIRMAQVHRDEMPLGEFDGTQWWFVVKD
ncbi:MAG: hypothetical protein IPL26_19785 [Leptospiraceae bacterium]|nr:hypothetical protein [Leptospiraceae bacterium]